MQENILAQFSADFTQDIVLREAHELWERANISSAAGQPHAILLGGQPGAGKTILATTYMAEFADSFLINADEYRPLHPRFSEIYDLVGSDFPSATSAFAGAVAEALIDIASENRANIIVEGTLRTVDVPLRTAQLLTGRGYDVDLAVIVVRPEWSYLSIKRRAKILSEQGDITRATKTADHDKIVRLLPENLNKLYAAGILRSIRLLDRSRTVLYDSRDVTTNPGDVLLREWNHPWSTAEKEEYDRQVSKL